MVQNVTRNTLVILIGLLLSPATSSAQPSPIESPGDASAAAATAVFTSGDARPTESTGPTEPTTRIRSGQQPADFPAVMPDNADNTSSTGASEPPTPVGRSVMPASLLEFEQIDVADPDSVAAPATPISRRLSSRLFGSGGPERSLIGAARRSQTYAPGTDLVFGPEGVFRVSSEAGDQLGKALQGRGLSTQRRNAVSSDPRIRGGRTARMTASGSYWFPARQDLDTMLNKIDSRILRDMIVVKGPYSSRYGPGFGFVDFQLLESPRYDGFGYEGMTSSEYKHNGEQFYGRQMVMAGADDWGIRVSYGHRTGNDYNTGGAADGSFLQPESLPTSYNSRDFDLAFGWDLSECQHLEFNYLRLDQTGVEFPGMVFDMEFLVTDAFELEYVVEDQAHYDRLSIEGWYNRTRFAGDTRRPGKNRQLPNLTALLAPFNFPIPGHAATDVDAMSTGYRLDISWGDVDTSQFTVGTDLIRLSQQLNDIENPENQPAAPTFLAIKNFPIGRSHSTDVGLFFDWMRRPDPAWTVVTGGRVDFVSTDSRDNIPFARDNQLVVQPMSVLKQAGLDQHFTLWSLFTTAEYELNTRSTISLGAGYAERQPSFTELYAYKSFIGSLQAGMTSVEGDPELDPERRLQVDAALARDCGALRCRVAGYFAVIRDYITYDHFNRPGGGFAPGQSFQQVFYTNTDLATIAGCEVDGELTITDCLDGFGSIAYVEGRDHTRTDPARLADIRRAAFIPSLAGSPRSYSNVEEENLPGIVPLEAVVGVRLHEPGPDSAWGLELSARIVDNQDRVAATLFEAPTPGFTIWNLRSFWHVTESLLVVSGVENLGDTFYREHLDYRAGRGVFQPGRNAYMLVESRY